jgi:spore maturation protein CgeB
LFDEKTEIAFFDETNLVEQVTYYLAQDALRQDMAQAALTKLKQAHSYRHRAEQLLGEIQARFCTA